MLDQSSLTAELVAALGPAAEAAAAALGITGAVQVAEPTPGGAEALGAASLAASLRVAGSLSGDLVLLSAPSLDATLDDTALGGLTALSPRVRGLRAAAESLGARFGEAAPADPADLSADACALVLVDGAPAAALALRLPPPPAAEPEAVAQPAAAPEAAAEQQSTTPVSPVSEPLRAMPAMPAMPVMPSVPVDPATAATRLDALTHVQMEVTVEIGRTRMSVGELLGLAPGQVIELDRAAGSPVDLFVNGTLLARGEVVVVDEDFGLRVTEIVTGQSVAPAGQA